MLFLSRKISHSAWRGFFALFLIVLCASFSHAQTDKTPHSQPSLIAETTSIAHGTPFTVALRLKMEKHWHSYWINPGDSGLATTLKWKLPAGFAAGAIQWPHPQKISTPPLMTYGYEDEVWLLTEITPPSDLPTGQPVTLNVEAKWLICKEACLPANANLKITLPVESTPATPDARWSEAFASARAKLPIQNSDWQVTAERAAKGDGLVLRIRPPANANADWIKNAYFFADKTSTIEHAEPQKVVASGDDFLLQLTPSTYATEPAKRLSGILLAPEGSAWNGESARALAIDAPIQKAGTTATQSNAPDPIGSTPNGAPTFPLALLLALGGGLLLNLMPCVFPVLSLKILGFAQQSGEDKSRIKKHGFAFGAGVLLSFWALAGVLLLLRAGGGSAGWGFQLQSPIFVASLVLLLTLVGLNLLGAFEIGVSLTRVSMPRTPSDSSHGGYGSSFWSGVLATVVATPCTAPFMGSALAYALTQPAGVALLVFTFLGVGMALPYVVLSLNPAWVKKLPRPGAWMETFKQLMAFPIFATALWLLAIFGLQTGVEGMSYLLGALLLMGLAIWVWHRWGQSTLPAPRQFLVRATTLFSLMLALFVAWSSTSFLPPETTTSDTSSKTAWQPYSPEKVEAALDAGKPVFIDFTAAWCITCQVNKRTTLRQPEIMDAFAKRDVVLMSADWTRRDTQITAALESYGRNGVPTYVLLPGKEVKPQVLPEVLSHSVVLNALETIQPRLASDSSKPQ